VLTRLCHLRMAMWTFRVSDVACDPWYGDVAAQTANEPWCRSWIVEILAMPSNNGGPLVKDVGIVAGLGMKPRFSDILAISSRVQAEWDAGNKSDAVASGSEVTAGGSEWQHCHCCQGV
jgi:hypothetical protein